MKITFYSNFLTHHQVPFCLEMKKKLGDDFKFVSTVKIFQWRLDLGFKDLDKQYDFVIRSYESREEYEKAQKLALESDVVIIGSTTDELIQERLEQDKVTFRYRSRIFLFLDGFIKTIFNKEKIKLLYTRHIKYRNNKNLYLLCANGYGANDFNFLGLYKDKIYKWGYFLETNKYDIEDLIDKKEENQEIQMVWVARFIKWKNPRMVVKLAKNLKRQNYNFHIKMIGTGVLEKKIKEEVERNNLGDVIEIVGQVPSEKVKDYYEKANIFIGTSDSREGWGAVVNEAMNAGCTVIANQRMGSVPFLIRHNENGLMYNNYKELEEQVKSAIEDKEIRMKLGKNAYKTVTEDWSSTVATHNLLELFEHIIDGKKYKVESGPASKAENYKRIKIK